MNNLYLYHATDIENVKSIKQEGLITNPPQHNWDNMFLNNMIFLAINAEIAEDYFMTAEKSSGNMTLFKIRLSDLDKENFSYDYNNKCDDVEDINSCAYNKTIPPDLLELCSDDEPDQTIFDFKGTDLYEILVSAFEEQLYS